MWRRRTAWVTGFASSVLALGCSPSPPAADAVRPVTLTVGAPQTRGLGTERSIAGLTSRLTIERLTTYDRQGRPAPKLVERWAQSPDGLTWRLTVRREAAFLDGTPLKTDDVRDAILRASANPDLLASNVCLSDIRDVSSDGSHDVVIRLARPCYYLLDDLDVEVSRTGPGGQPVGTGPFRPVATSQDEVTLEANSRYYAGPPAIDRLVLRAYDTLRAPWAEMMRGQVDFLLEVSPDAIEFLQDQSAIETRSYTSFNCMAIVLNQKRAAFKSADVRRALNMAVDRTELVQMGLKGQGLPADVPVWPSLWAFDRGAPAVPFDPARARALLRRSQGLTFTCLLPQHYAVFERLALLAQRQLRAVGVDMRVEMLPPGAFIDRVNRGNYDAALIDPMGGPYPAVLYRFWHSPDPAPRWNQFEYRNASVDAALDGMRGALTDAQFQDALGRFVVAMRNDPPAIFLVWPNRTQAISRRFVLPPESVGTDASRSLGTWRLREDGR